MKDFTWNLSVAFEDERTYLQFRQEGNSAQRKNIPGRIAMPMYLAVKQRLLRMPYQLQLMDPRIAEKYCYQVTALLIIFGTLKDLTLNMLKISYYSFGFYYIREECH